MNIVSRSSTSTEKYEFVTETPVKGDKPKHLFKVKELKLSNSHLSDLSNSYLSDPEKIKMALCGHEKCSSEAKSTLSRDICKFMDANTWVIERMMLESGEFSTYHEEGLPAQIAEAMLKLDFMIRQGYLFESCAELAEILENQKTKSIFNTKLKAQFVFWLELLKSSEWGSPRSEGWIDFNKILMCIVEGWQPVCYHAIQNGSSKVSSNVEKKISLIFPSLDASLDDFYFRFTYGDGFFSSESIFFEYIKLTGNEKKVDSESIKNLVLIYPLFTNMEKLIKHIGDFDLKHGKYILNVIKEQANDKFLNCKRSDVKTLKSLHQKFKKPKEINPAIECKRVDVSTGPLQSDLKSVNAFDWRACDEKHFAEALTARDSSLIMAIDYDDIKLWMNGQDILPDSVISVEKT
ncbi:MAG TPA: hypothetical protein VGP47_09060, partial [Parachlamydiaceae bacterium]|nr:hypothetical protein [Parachlamydiaceae bacterium]